MYKIIYRSESGEDVEIFAAKGENLLALARKANVAIDAPCSGNGSCGKCRVQLVSGEVEASPSRHISDEEFREGRRLTCVSSVCADAVLLVPDIASAYRSRMKVADLSSQNELATFNTIQESLLQAGIAKSTDIRVVDITLEPPTLDDTMPDNERLTRALSAQTDVGDVQMPFSVMKKLPDIMRDSEFSVRAVIKEANGVAEVLDVLPGGDDMPVCGLAIDIGTTTVSGLLVELQSGKILAKASTGNGQIRYGADVINRIVEQQKTGGIKKLQEAIVEDTLNPIIDAMCKEAGVGEDHVYRMVVASNTTMNHLLLGINANHLRMEPYIPAFFELPEFHAAELGLEISEMAQMYIAPNIGSYVGGDITAGTLAGMSWNSSELSILIDLGTNGEIVFGNSDFLMACACSAGPAFEGGDISCGMRATDGAVEACKIDMDTMEPELTVIGGVKPAGICGSGIIDAIAELFRCGIINGKGKLSREGERVRCDEYGIGSFVLAFAKDSATNRDIVLTEVDIDNFIRAKGAIFSAVMSLITPLGFSTEDVERMYVAGGIGSGINIGNAIRIGMFPDLPEEKYSYIGNSSLTGAYAVLTSKDAEEKLSELYRNMTYIELSTQPGYMDEFLAACFLPHTDANLFPSVGI